jgi:endo-1,4-beta-xylanase
MYSNRANTLNVSAKSRTVKHTKVAKKNTSLKVLGVSKAQGKVTYAKKGGNKKITVNKKTGKATVKKGLAKGTYKVKVKVTAAGNANYKKASKTITFKVIVK